MVDHGQERAGKPSRSVMVACVSSQDRAKFARISIVRSYQYCTVRRRSTMFVEDDMRVDKLLPV